MSNHRCQSLERTGRAARRRWHEPIVIAIVGGSGAGKSRLAEVLQVKWGGVASRISLDDFYRDSSHLAPRICARVNFDHPRSVDWTLFERVLREGRGGRAVTVPRYDFSRHARREEWERWKPERLVLVDGLWLLLRRRTRRLFDLSIFIECGAKLRLRRRLERDVQQRGRSPEAIQKQFSEQVIPMHARYVARQKQWADYVVRSPLGERTIGCLMRAITRLCQEGRSE